MTSSDDFIAPIPVQTPQLPGYAWGECLHQGSKTVVYQAVESTTGRSVVIKYLCQEHPSFGELVQFRNQYAIAHNLSIPGVVRPLGLEPLGNRYALLMEDTGGIALEKYIQHQPLTLIDVLGIALQLADILHHLQQQRVIHKDIKPANILIHPDSKRVKLIDFSIASLLPKESQEIQNPDVLEGTLAYLAPEQTGRMNRGIDYRADFYSLGVTLYKLLSDRLPFTAADPMELIHCHMAKVPVSVDQVNPSVPTMVGTLVTKLMAKNAEDRYQSALGLKHDLEQCLTQWKEAGNISEFDLGQRDLCDRFLISEKLYGREAEVQKLLTAFERVSKGDSELMLVAGFSGIGKTAVVREIHKPITRQKGYFIQGKFDQFNRDIPFSAFVQAFRSLIGQLLGESDAALAAWKTKILAALGENGQVIVDVIPELVTIIGETAPVPALSGRAAQNRFNLFFDKFVRIFATREHPLVIFLDDLQWSDLASLNLLKVLMEGAQSEYLLVVGAYRDNEVSPAHPLMLCLGDVKKQGGQLTTLTLASLGEPDINQMVADTLLCQLPVAKPLSQLIYQKTQGNPFFSAQFLQGLHQEGCITFDAEAGYWQCDMANVRSLALTDDVVTFMVGQLQKLPHQTQEILKLAACIGNHFDLQTLAKVCVPPEEGHSHRDAQEDVAAALWSALQEGLIVPESETYKFFQERDSNSEPIDNIAVSYRFLHDRVQQAAYSLIHNESKQITHLRIGQLLWQKTSKAEREENLFKIVNQLNIGLSLLNTSSEREEIAQLNLEAARKAKASAAYNAAANYSKTAIALLSDEASGDNIWQIRYALMLQLHTILAEVSYLNGEFETAEQQIQTIINSAIDLLDSVKAYEIRISLLVAQGQCQAALDVGLEILTLLDVSLDDTPLPNIEIERLDSLPTIADRKIAAALGILSKLWAPAFIASPSLLPKVILTMLNLSAVHGNSAVGAFSYALYGMFLCATMTDIELGYRFGELALRILDRYEDVEFTCKVNQLVHAFIRNWKEPARDRIECLADNVLIGLETGDIEFACYSAINYCDNLCLIGESLEVIHQKQTYYIELIANLRQEFQYFAAAIWGQFIDNLMGIATDPKRLVGQRFNEAEEIANLKKLNALTALFFFYTVKTILHYLFDDWEGTLTYAKLGTPYEQAGGGLLPTTQIPFYQTLALLALYPKANSKRQTQILDDVKINQQRLAVWARHAPENFQHKLDLIEAEIARVLGHRGQAVELYDRAISGAQASKYIHEEALANELSAKFYLDWNKVEVAAVYLRKAYDCYASWGAKAKTAHLEEQYPQLLASTGNQQTTQSQNRSVFNLATTPHQTTTCSATTTAVSQCLDLGSLMKATRMLSQDIELDRTIANLMNIIQENAGAQTVALMLLHQETLTLEAKVIDSESQPVENIPVQHSQDVPLSIVNTVQNTQQAIVLDDASAEPTYAGDAYIQQHHPKSVLCLPLRNHQQKIGILYLENNQCSGAFTTDRVEILTLLCAQAAITLQNSRLYHQAQQALQLEKEIHDLQRTQLQLIQKEKMHSLGQMVGGIAHEINNPNTFIGSNVRAAGNYMQDVLGLLQLYQNHYPNPHPEIQDELEVIDLPFLQTDFQSLLKSIKTGSDRIKNIVTSLRTFSRLDEADLKAVDLHAGLDSTLTILQTRLQTRGQHQPIQVIKDYGKLPLIECYAGQINQAFLHILSNAIDALAEGEYQDSPTIQICTRIEAENVILEIVDNGIGMSDDICHRIFDPFFTTKTVGKGTGLGLAIAYQIITENHRGTIKVDSTVGQGTEFRLSLPCKQERPGNV